ncbi:hypothetical protein [Candidatus Nitrosacidococcus sp. I8]|uniref:hypothetical protein n=1 Tax=Candidatus Nitrosacidococcus sp. I8 TaxID=2942908 RepID=UPI002227057E|nr:hypothetical protein [Candidatus Nitrosacidococcus sp. I8]
MAIPSNLTSILIDDNGSLYFDYVNNLIRNTAFGVPLTAYMKNSAPLPKTLLIIGINPLPSFITLPGLPDWKQVRESLYIKAFVPYGTLGELVNYGWVWLFFYYFFVGVIATWVDIKLRIYKENRKRFGFFISNGLLFLFALSSTEYPLRSSTRLLYYAVAIALLWRFLCRIRIKPRI